MSTFSRVRGRRTVAGVCLLALVCLGCTATVSRHVPAAAIAGLPIERQLGLLDAESDVLAGQDAQSDQEDRVHAARAALDEARATEEGARRQVATAGSRAVADAAMSEAKTHREYCEQAARLERSRLATAEMTLTLMQARFELARAREVDAAGQGSHYSVRVPDYQRQLDAIEAELRRRTAEDEHISKDAEARRSAWLDKSRALAQLTGGSQGSVWVQ